MINHDTIKQAAERGTGLDHLTPGQAWAAHEASVKPKHLRQPMRHSMILLLASVEQKARQAFFSGVEHGDTDEMIYRAYDDRHPMFLRGPILETLQEGMETFFPDLKATAVDDDGNAVYRLDNLAKALGASEEELLALAKEKGMEGRLQTKPIHILH
ncbi:hypothetical protein [Vreelandella maris]|uniref:Uncharacterized protein n=1 Tax=Vreelandella maris TaxID=2729617 RepID=A0A7Y6RBI4_9GAMM|nr:hypothetical protein [Halomonas maris]NVF13763.1 hypothetical protein [Halomonas maris]|tara:strand:- start:1096 stop:1566 length:471 start_codon:yes stop_codon:yes gene_type:complete